MRRPLLIFLFGTGLTLLAGDNHAADRSAQPHLVTDPTYPGEDLPPRGRSLFDFLVAEQRVGKPAAAVPYPFAALVQQIEQEMRHGPESKGTQAVLIPLGRSLQRMAAAPEFFAYPRAVVVTAAEPLHSGNIYLKDRLYLGYQEKANLIEVISYNEDAARFEFQIVTDYREGGTPRVAYANRALCTACHQNAAPIFSRQVWDETNANPRVAARLAAQRKDFYDIPVDRGVDVPNAIDNAKLRANRFAVDQLLWREGCGGNEEPALRCRAVLFAAALQYRLSGQQQFDRDSPSYREAVQRLGSVSQQRWPGGLAIGDPDLPNRNPLANISDGALAMGAGVTAQLADVTVAFDPLRLRPPQEVWRETGETDVQRLIAGLAEFIATPDVEQLDRALFSQAVAQRTARRTYQAACTMRPANVERGVQRIEFRCTRAPGADNFAFAMDGRLLLGGNELAGPPRRPSSPTESERAARSLTTTKLVGGVIDRLEIEGAPPLADIDLIVPRERRPTPIGGSTQLEKSSIVALARGGLHVRAADGNAFEQIEFRWRGTEGTASLRLLDDFAPARKAIAALLGDQRDGKFDGFSSAAFRRARLMPALLSYVGAAGKDWCCLDPSSLPPAQLASVGPQGAPAAAAATTTAAHAGFQRYCGQCHLGSERAPPNFLAGDADAIERKLKQCAPRIFVRLAMWRHDANARAKTPMPPEVALNRFEVSAEAWRDGDALTELMGLASERLRAETGKAPDADSLLREGYENLRACLP